MNTMNTKTWCFHTATGTYFRGTVVEVDPRPAGPAAWDPWETVSIQWDPTANDPGAVERVNPCMSTVWLVNVVATSCASFWQRHVPFVVCQAAC